MDKAEKIKAARKKLKDFQSQKDHLTSSTDGTEGNLSQEISLNVVNNPVQPAKIENHQHEPVQQQQVSTFNNESFNNISSIPQISNYFDNANGSSSAFDIPVPELSSQTYAQHEVSAVNYYTPQQNPIQYVSANDAKSTELQQTVNHQNVQISQLKSEVEFHRSTATNLQKAMEDFNRLKQETQSHGDVIKILVSEKSSLMDALNKSEQATKTKFDENEELQNRLNASRHRVKQLEIEMKNVHTQHKPATNYNFEDDARRIEEAAALKVKQFQAATEHIQTEKNELRALLNQKRTEMENLQKNFDHINTELHLANVRIAQLSDGAPTGSNESINQSQIYALSQEIAIKHQQLTELSSTIDQINRDKELSDNQYQNYVSHLSLEMESLKQNLSELSGENDCHVKREQELLKHVSDLERQIQQQIQKQKTYAEDNASPLTGPSQEELIKLTSQVTALNEANNVLKSQLIQIEAEKSDACRKLDIKIEEMKTLEIQLEQSQIETPNLPQLMSDFEDKSVAAARAVSQNQSLKDQLDEMQRAFITMANDKMELTDKLQSEMHLCKEMKTRYESMEADLKEMKGKWQYKEDEMIRLSHVNTEQEKKIFQQNIEIDRLRHYESKGGTEGIIENELENCKRLIEVLTNKINILESNRTHQDDHKHDDHHHNHKNDDQHHDHKHDDHHHDHKHDDHHHNHKLDDHKHGSEEHHHHGSDEHHDHKHGNTEQCNDGSKKHLLEEIAMLKMEKSELIKAMHDFKMHKKSEDKIPLSDADSILKVNGDEPLEMNDDTLKSLIAPISVTPSIATEEALEKLQERFRRTMLEVAELTEEKQRLEHVVTQLQFETETIGEYITLYQYQRRMLKQKEHERDIQLKNLSADRERMNQKLMQLNMLIEKFVLQHTDQIEFAKEASKLLDKDSGYLLNNTEPLYINTENQNIDLLKLKQETAGKILEILSDIKSTNTRTYCDSNIGVEHCSCCMGKLETV